MTNPAHSSSVQAGVRDNEGERLSDELRETRKEMSEMTKRDKIMKHIRGMLEMIMEEKRRFKDRHNEGSKRKENRERIPILKINLIIVIKT